MSILRNLTWAAAAKWYIFAAGLLSQAAAESVDAPGWLHLTVGLVTLVASWLKTQTPAEDPLVE